MKDVKLLVMDVDGTLTDGRIYMSAAGEAFKSFSIKDGYGIGELLPKNNVIPVIITGRISEILKIRAKELKVSELFQGVQNKLEVLVQVINRYGYRKENVAYIGDDIPDLVCMKECGWVGCPSDAVKEVKSLADFVAPHKGGDGAVRDFIEWLIN